MIPFLARLKFWLEGGWTIASLYQIALLSLIASDKIQSIIPIPTTILIPSMVLIIFVSIIALGYFLDKIKFVTHYFDKQGSLNPYWKKNFDQMTRIENELKDLKERLKCMNL